MPSIRLDITSARKAEHNGDKSVRKSDREQNFVGFFSFACTLPRDHCTVCYCFKALKCEDWPDICPGNAEKPCLITFFVVSDEVQHSCILVKRVTTLWPSCLRTQFKLCISEIDIGFNFNVYRWLKKKHPKCLVSNIVSLG